MASYQNQLIYYNECTDPSATKSGIFGNKKLWGGTLFLHKNYETKITSDLQFKAKHQKRGMFSVLGGQNSFKSGRGSPLPCAPWLRAYEGSKQSAKKLQDIICNHTPNFNITFGGSTASASIWFLDNFLIAHHIIFIKYFIAIFRVFFLYIFVSILSVFFRYSSVHSFSFFCPL